MLTLSVSDSLTAEGLLVQEDWKTSEGLNAVFTTNVLGHFLLVRVGAFVCVRAYARARVCVWVGGPVSARVCACV